MLLIADRSQRGGWWSGSRSSGALCACQWKDSRPYYSEWKSIGSCCFDPRRCCLHTNERFTLHTAQELNSIIISLSLARQLLVNAERSIKKKKKDRESRLNTGLHIVHLKLSTLEHVLWMQQDKVEANQ